MGLQGVIRGRRSTHNECRNKAAPCPLDLVNRQFKAPRPERAVGVRLHLRLNLGRLRLRGVRHRCVRPPDRWLARQPVGTCRASCSMRWSRPLHDRKPLGGRRPDPPLGPGCAIRLDQVQRSGWRTPAWCLRSAASATATTTRSPKRSTGFTKLK